MMLETAYNPFFCDHNCTIRFVHWVLYTAGPYTQLIGHDVMILSRFSNNQLCLDTYSDTRFAEFNFAVMSSCDSKNINQQWRILGEAFPCMLWRSL
jgi:hypothetical protein